MARFLNCAAEGRRAEHRARALLKAEGYEVVRAAASKGPCDLVAWGATSIRLISVKSGTRYASAIEREALQMLVRPANASRSVAVPTRCREPLIEAL